MTYTKTATGTTASITLDAGWKKPKGQQAASIRFAPGSITAFPGRDRNILTLRDAVNPKFPGMPGKLRYVRLSDGSIRRTGPKGGQ